MACPEPVRTLNNTSKRVCFRPYLRPKKHVFRGSTTPILGGSDGGLDSGNMMWHDTYVFTHLMKSLVSHFLCEYVFGPPILSPLQLEANRYQIRCQMGCRISWHLIINPIFVHSNWDLVPDLKWDHFGPILGPFWGLN